MNDFDERALVERCRAGDDIAFSELVDRYKNLVFAIVNRMVNDGSQADDLAQEVFLKVHRGLPYFRGDARLSTWIYRIVANVCSEVRSRRTFELPLETGTEDRPRRERGASDAAFKNMELRDRLGKALDQLPDQYRFLVEAHYLEGVQYEALAEA